MKVSASRLLAVCTALDGASIYFPGDVVIASKRCHAGCAEQEHLGWVRTDIARSRKSWGGRADKWCRIPSPTSAQTPVFDPKSQMNRARLLLSCSPLLLLLLWNRFRASQSDIAFDQAMKELLLTASAGELQTLLRSGNLTSVQLVKACLGQIAQYDRSGPNLRAIVSTPPEKDVLSIAERLDKERAAGKVRGPFHGIPIIVKVRYVHLSHFNFDAYLCTARKTPSTLIPRSACRQRSARTPSKNRVPRATLPSCKQ